jgi:hypothetical protein
MAVFAEEFSKMVFPKTINAALAKYPGRRR